jgi:putative transposase
VPKLRHYDNLNTARFVTFSCFRRHKLLTHPDAIRIFLDVLEAVRKAHRIRLHAYVIMPEHVHLLIYPLDELALGPVIGELKWRSASQILTRDFLWMPSDCLVRRNGRERRAFWMPRCYDHNCRCPATVAEKIKYCHFNPVKRGLVKGPEDWMWSSFNWYQGVEDVPIRLDSLEGLS